MTNASKRWVKVVASATLLVALMVPVASAQTAKATVTNAFVTYC